MVDGRAGRRRGPARRELFSPAEWAARTGALVDRLVAVTDAIAAGDDDALASGFVVGAAALQHARRDPLLPTELLPRDWPGDELRESYSRFQRAFAESISDALPRARATPVRADQRGSVSR